MVTLNQVTPITFPNLPDATTLTGNEYLAISQANASAKTTINALPAGMEAGVIVYGNTGGAPFPNYRTLEAGAGVTISDGGAQAGLIVSVDSVDLLPSQGGNAGRFLKTDGTNPSWAVPAGGGTVITSGSPVAGNLTKFSASDTITNGDLSGDITTAGALVATLATVNANVGSFGTSTSIPSLTVNAKGLVTAASGNAVIAPAGTLTGTTLASGVTASSLTSFGNSPTLVTPVLGTPTSGNLLNCTDLPISTGVSGLAAGMATFLATPSSANLKATVTDETGSGALVFATSPTFVTPVLGVPTSGTLSNCTSLPLSTGVTGTLPVGNGGTSGTTWTVNALLKGNGTSALVSSGVTVDAVNAMAGYLGSINAQSGTSYTLQASDSGKIIEFSNASSITATLPNSLGTGFAVTCVQGAAGQVTFSPAGGAALHNASSFTKTRTQYSFINLYVTSNVGGAAAVYNMGGDGST